MKPDCDCRNWRKYIKPHHESGRGIRNVMYLVCRVHGMVRKTWPLTKEQEERIMRRAK